MSSSASAHPLAPLTLDRLPLGTRATVSVVAPSGAGAGPDWGQQLGDIGFIPGESVSVVARAWPGGDPLVVRVGHSRFALRVAEAACVQVLAPGPRPVEPAGAPA